MTFTLIWRGKGEGGHIQQTSVSFAADGVHLVRKKKAAAKKRSINTSIFLHIYTTHILIYTLKDKLYILCIFTLQCCAQAPLIRQRSTSQNPLLVGVGFAYIGPRHSTSKNPLLLLLSAWGQIYRDLTPRDPPARFPNPKAVTHILQGGWCKTYRSSK